MIQLPVTKNLVVNQICFNQNSESCSVLSSLVKKANSMRSVGEDESKTIWDRIHWGNLSISPVPVLNLTIPTLFKTCSSLHWCLLPFPPFLNSLPDKKMHFVWRWWWCALGKRKSQQCWDIVWQHYKKYSDSAGPAFIRRATCLTVRSPCSNYSVTALSQTCNLVWKPPLLQ